MAKEKMVTRTVKETKIMAKVLKYANGVATAEDIEPLTVKGKIVGDAAFKLLCKTYGTQAYADIQCVTTQQIYGIPVSIFEQYAVPVARTNKQEEN